MAKEEQGRPYESIDTRAASMRMANNFDEGKKYIEEGKRQQGMEFLQREVQLNPYNDEAWFLLGREYYKLGSEQNSQEFYKKSLEHCKRAAQVNSRHELALYLTGCLYYILYNSLLDSITYLEKAIQVNPNNESTWYILGEVYNSKGNRKKAIECCQKAIQINPNSDAKKLLNKLE